MRQRRRQARSILAASLGLAFLIPAAASATTDSLSPAAPAGDSVVTVEPELIAELPEALALDATNVDTEQCGKADDGGTQVCVTIDAPQDGPAVQAAPDDAHDGRGGEAISPQAIVPLPDWCLEAGVTGSYLLTRTDGCAITEGVLTVTQTSSTGVVTVVGTMHFLMYRLIYTTTNGLTWGDQMEVSPTVITGAAAGTTITGTPNCTGGGCVLASSVPISGTPGVGGRVRGESYYTSAPATGGAVTGSSGWRLSFKSPTVATPAVYNTDKVVSVRCDNALPGRGPGCVLPYVTGRIQYPAAYFPEFGAHVSSAQASGLPGNVTPLHRTTNTALRDSNRSIACKTSAVIPRPSGKDCDEYPFASTYEGAASGGPGRTFPGCGVTYYPTGVTSSTGYSICMIDSAENQLAGSQLNTVLFVPYRIIDGDPFFVSIT